jgi:hypothetical protein
MTDLKQAAQQALEALIDAANVLSAPMFADAADALREALAQPEQEQEPVAWMVTYGGLTHIEYTLPSKVVDTHYQPLYTTPPAAQREWVGLTDEDVNRESAMIASKMKLAFHAGMYVAQNILKERNT